MNNWPSQAEVLSDRSVYGNPRGPGGVRMSAKWEAANILYVKAPFRMTYAGKPVTRGFRIHKHCAPSMARVLDNLWDAADGRQADLDHWGVSIFGGCTEFRLMRGGSTLSIHSYGAAIDLDPANNGLGDRTPRFAQFPQVLAAFAAERWRWGGDWNRNGTSADDPRADGMHWQATA